MTKIVTVKPLVWVDGRFSSTPREVAETVFGRYEVILWADGTFGGSLPARPGEDYREEFSGKSSLGEAKAAAQADYERRILSAISVDPMAVAEAATREAVRKALEQAADMSIPGKGGVSGVPWDGWTQDEYEIFAISWRNRSLAIRAMMPDDAPSPPPTEGI